ncbi:MAG: NADH-quinone oxidoreductase subunit J [Kordiimonadaceae bacterium]|jgi:NADH-quinone oxidoreductase subunit J|nr:NADH-quinone oxidoreductase subunit J [Kordiimonadaceae bacterium]MDB4044267.1 NADH-quinone oxidoreductase subunit J [Emcibacteraceae bacterium]MDB4591358.1 NADH-quinone oxidoreductase subunit J [Flavobacteriaceae bacterium]MBT6467059.1 NADH-quinone oxidoreductase subunit J [Kordiimonadaceae bacterium]MBT7605827.1 NADH-quinone oxidoreductase subunit J [Kordiimonadaceae bacterium]|tara:strand:- start:33756 stop:34367 length:612 start_codon:yes stop_codon:yes gene_type:complete
MITAICFYIFATILIGSGIMVVFSKNPVHSVLFLILAFFNAAGLFVLLGAEFVAMILVIVYVGAVAVMFLFVVMMLDINFTELRKGVQDYLPIGLLIGIILMVEMVVIVGGWSMTDGIAVTINSATPKVLEVTNTDAIGRILYTDNIFLFQLAGLILLVAMIGAIVLTHRKRSGVKKQDIGKQVRRRRHEAYEAVDVKPGQGI